MNTKTGWAFTLLMLFFSAELLACTTLSLKNDKGTVVFARNFDFPVGIGHIEINQRDRKKVAFLPPGEKPMEWISMFGSVTFNQGGREFPYGGMNEAGLVIELMWLQEARYPAPDTRFGLSELQWIQYQLDVSASVQEVIDSDTLVRISNTSVAFLHFLVSDQSGDVATIEFLEGQRVVHRGTALPFPVLSNCIYTHSLEYRENLENNTGKSYNDWTRNSSGRFARAAQMVDAYDGQAPIIDYAFSILDSVAQENSTQWSIVYDQSHRKILYKSRLNPEVMEIDMQSLNFSCTQPELHISMTDREKGDRRFKPYTYEDNLELIREVFSNVDFLKENITVEMIEASARYPETVHCE